MTKNQCLVWSKTFVNCFCQSRTKKQQQIYTQYLLHLQHSNEHRKPQKRVQFKCCQQYDHTKNTCMQFRCVKCAEDHSSTDEK